jgi:hypothetical protein
MTATTMPTTRLSGEIHQFRMVTVSSALLWLKIGVGDGHAEAPRAAGDCLADSAEADDTQSLAADLSPQRGAAMRPMSAADEVVARGDTAGHRQQQCERHIGDIVGQNIGRSSDADATSPSAVQVDGVGADAIDGDDLQRRQGIDEFVGGSVPAARNKGSDVRPDARQ